MINDSLMIESSESSGVAPKVQTHKDVLDHGYNIFR